MDGTDRVIGSCMLVARGSHEGRSHRQGDGGRTHMADVLYVVLLLGIFAVLGLALRGLERL